MFLKTNRINVKTQANCLRFHLEQPASDYPILHLDEMPHLEVCIVPSDKSASGIGEMGVPPVAPAIANAVYAAIGRRIRHIPIRPEDLMA